MGQTNDRVHQRYQNSLMGDSPELMPLDNSLFSDLVEGIGKHVVATWAVTENDAKMTPFPLKEKFSMATPDEAWDTMVAVWSGSKYVTSKRIIEDVDKVHTALEMIVKNNGCIVKEINPRNGHRRAASQIATGGRLHPNAARAMLVQMSRYKGLSGPPPTGELCDEE